MNKEIKNSVLAILYKKAPNSVREEIILQELKGHGVDEIKKTLESLVAERLLESLSSSNDRTGQNFTTYKLTSYTNIPIKTSTLIGDIQFPRLMDGDVARAEDVNQLIEGLASYNNSLEERFHEILKKEMRSYWINIITLFGFFVASFSLILRSAEKIIIEPTWTIKRIFLINLAQLLPLALTLIGFAVLLKFLFRK